jgi:hypothetical protein
MAVTYSILFSTQRDQMLSPEGNTHPLMESKTLKIVAWKISGNQNKLMAYQKTLQYFSP